jgi:hypothetical protein
VPSVSLAVALSPIDAGAVNDAPGDGAVNETDGGRFDDGGVEVVTLTVRVADVVDAPPLSLATAFNVWEPAVAPDHVILYGLDVSLAINVEPS